VRVRAWAASLLVFVAASLVVFVVSGCGSGGTRWRDDDEAWSPNGRAIVFISNRADPKGNTFRLYLSNVTAKSKARELVRGDDAYPRFSPDGQRIVYFASSLGSTALDVVDANGLKRHELASGSDIVKSIPAAWSPDGRWIAFVRADPAAFDPVYRLWVVGPGRHERRLAAIVGGNFSQLYAWSPDSRRLVYGCYQADLCVVDLSGHVRRLTRDRAAGSIRSVAWSPNGEQIAFIRGTLNLPNVGDVNESAWVIDRNGRGEHVLPQFIEGSVDQLLWLPGHPRTLLASTEDGTIAVGRSDGNGGNVVALGGWATDPVPSPDGRLLAYSSPGPVRDDETPQTNALVIVTLPDAHAVTSTQTWAG
jgi:Tol biopolymer transport system component